jgi:LysM repeat protein
MDPKAKQYQGGPGRGLFQFEGESFDTALKRYKNIASAKGFSLKENIINATSADQLSAEDQYTLFFANLIESKAKLSDYTNGTLSAEDLWLSGHKNVEAKGDRASFLESQNASKKDGIKNGYKTFQEGGEKYKVASGDNLGSIANRFNTSVEELVSLNNINNPDLINIDQELMIPEATNVSTANKVKSGDTSGKIAKTYKTDLRKFTNTAIDNTYIKQQLPFKGRMRTLDSDLPREEVLQIYTDYLDSKDIEETEYNDPRLTSDFVKNSNQYAENFKTGFVDYSNKTDEEVQQLQATLIDQGYDVGATGTDGNYGPRTHKAYTSMLEDVNLNEGSISRYYKNYQPSTQTEVEAIQNNLVSKGYLPEETEYGKSNIDGKFGQRTKEALIAYNAANVEEDPKAQIFENIPSKLNEERCAAGMCNILELNDVETEALGIKFVNAWNILGNMIKLNNSKMIFNIYDDSAFDNINSETTREELERTTRDVKRKIQTKAADYKVGDIIGIYWPGSKYWDQTLESDTHNTHTGFVSEVVDGVPIITHNVGGDVRQQPWEELQTTWISRPNKNITIQSTYADQGIEEELAGFEVDENLIANFETKIERSISDSEKKVVGNIIKRSQYNSTKIPKILNSSVDPKWLAATTFGIVGVETGAGLNANRTRADIGKDSMFSMDGLRSAVHNYKGTKEGDISLGIGKNKFSALDAFSKNYFDIKSPTDLADDNKSLDVISYQLVKRYELFKDYSKQYPKLGLNEEDIRNMAILSHNQGSNKLIKTGRNKKNPMTSKEEVVALRELYKGTMVDITSTNYNRIPVVGKMTYDAALGLGYEKPSERYISKVNRYATEVFKGPSVEESDMRMAHQSIPTASSNNILSGFMSPFSPLKLSKGGEYGVFNNYINGDYNNTPRQKSAEKVFDKLNRKHYKEAKVLGMSPANYILTHILSKA